MSSRVSILLMLLLCTGSGCFKLSSKWAMSDPDYAKKYSAPYPEDDAAKAQRLTKQMLDARHVAGDSGTYLKGAYSTEPDAGQLELGGFAYPNSFTELHGGLSVLAGEQGLWGFPGLDLGMRIQTPSRIAPFVGAGVFGDLSETILVALLDDDDDCGCDESYRYVHSFAAVYPEIGIHYWLDGTTRATLSAGYYFNSEGRDEDFWLIGFTIGGVTREEPTPDDLIWYDDAEEVENFVELRE